MQKKLYVDPIMRIIREKAYIYSIGKGFEMTISEFGEDAPILGAAFIDEARSVKTC